jgi:hypothetical protein
MSISLYNIRSDDQRLGEITNIMYEWAENWGVETVITSQTHQVSE